MIGRILCFLGLHHNEYMGVDYRTYPASHVIRCTRCRRRIYTQKKPRNMKKADDFVVLDNGLTKILRELEEMTKDKRDA